MGAGKNEGEFGARVRSVRISKGIGLRKFAAMIDMSPTYLSKVERGEFNAPSEEKIVAIAEALEIDPDVLLALAGKVRTDLTEIIRRNPKEMATVLRRVDGYSPEEVQRLLTQLHENKGGDSL